MLRKGLPTEATEVFRKDHQLHGRNCIRRCNNLLDAREQQLIQQKEVMSEEPQKPKPTNTEDVSDSTMCLRWPRRCLVKGIYFCAFLVVFLLNLIIRLVIFGLLIFLFFDRKFNMLVTT